MREWVALDRTLFYDADRVALVPTGFCYPGRGHRSGLPPRPECAPRWHGDLLPSLTNVRLTLLIGTHAQAHFLGSRRKSTLTATVRAWTEYFPPHFALPHPSPRDGTSLGRPPWFERETLPTVKGHVAAALSGS